VSFIAESPIFEFVVQVIGARVAGAGTRIDYAVDIRVKLIRFAKRFQDGNNRI
jgi:hypothetical protein